MKTCHESIPCLPCSSCIGVPFHSDVFCHSCVTSFYLCFVPMIYQFNSRDHAGQTSLLVLKFHLVNLLSFAWQSAGKTRHESNLCAPCPSDTGVLFLACIKFKRGKGKQAMRTVTFSVECELRHHVSSDECDCDQHKWLHHKTHNSRLFDSQFSTCSTQDIVIKSPFHYRFMNKVNFN